MSQPHDPPSAASAAPRRFTFLLTGSRRDGNTEILTRTAAEHLRSDVEQQWLRLMDLPLPPFEDIRHSVGVYPQPEGNERVLFDATLSATDLVFAVPLYWYSLPAPAKLYLDYWSAWMRVPGADFKARMAGRTLWAVSVLSDEDPTQADPLIGSLERTAAYMGMRFGGVLLGYGNKPGEVLADAGALDRARTFFGGTAR